VAPNDHPEPPQTRLNPKKLLRVFRINIAVVDRVSNVIQPILLVGHPKALVYIMSGFVSKADL
jgi:hypothetical protein